MKKKVLKLNLGETISIINSNNKGVLIKNEDNILKIQQTNEAYDNIDINVISIKELTSFILTKLLEDNSIEIKDNKNNYILINELLENQYKNICGDNYNSWDITGFDFQIVTHYKKEEI